MTTSAPALPHWDMTVVYPSLDSPEFAAGFAAFGQAIADLGALFDAHGIAEQPAGALTDATVSTFETVTERYNTVLTEARTMGAYLGSFITTNSRDTAAQARYSELERLQVLLAQLGTRYTAWVGALDGAALLDRSAVAREHAYALERARVQATHLLSPPEEALAAELEVTGSSAWAKLYDNFVSQLMVPVELPHGTESLGMPAVRNMAYDPDRDLRRRGYEAELRAWEANALPIATALNSIQGEVLALSRRRRWDAPLDISVFRNSIDRPTLDAMMSAAQESFPDFRRYLRAKARALGLPRLAWYDLFAPAGQVSRVWSFDDARDFIVTQFGSYSPRMAGFAARAFREQWIDAEPRPGKRDGAFCMPLRRDESRILSNFKPVFDGMSTLAHELGHGYHNLNLVSRTPLQRQLPMTLAETASIFCETIVREAGLAHAEPTEQIAILEASLQGSCQVVVDITSRFLFEQAAFAGRAERELSVDEYKAHMLAAQQATYGDGLDAALLHPYMWAAKGHYYDTFSYYNYPYMFGLLFSLGLYARYEQDPAGFRTGYDDLLSATGLADAATLAKRFGIDIHTPDFWRASLAIIRADVDRFEGLVAAG